MLHAHPSARSSSLMVALCSAVAADTPQPIALYY